MLVCWIYWVHPFQGMTSLGTFLPLLRVMIPSDYLHLMFLACLHSACVFNGMSWYRPISTTIMITIDPIIGVKKNPFFQAFPMFQVGWVYPPNNIGSWSTRPWRNMWKFFILHSRQLLTTKSLLCQTSTSGVLGGLGFFRGKQPTQLYRGLFHKPI